MKRIHFFAICLIVFGLNNNSYAQNIVTNNAQDIKPKILTYCGEQIPSKILEKEQAPENQCLNYIKLDDTSAGYVAIYFGQYSNGTYCVEQNCTGQKTNNVMTLNVVPKPMGCNYIIWGRKINGKLEPLVQNKRSVMAIYYGGMQNNMPYFNIKYFKDNTLDLIEDVTFYSDVFKKYK